MGYGELSENRELAHIINIKKHYKNALRLNCYNFRMVNAISTSHFQHFMLHYVSMVKLYFGVLHLLHASIATSDIIRDSNPP